MSYGDPALAPSAGSAANILSRAAAAPSLSTHVDEIAAVNPLYSSLREAAANLAGEPDPRVRATLDRLRIMPAKGRAILVNSASAQLWMLEDGRPVDQMKVVVGRKISPTPLVAGTIHYVTLNPYWNIPADVARDKVAPIVLKRGVKYLKAARYVTSDGFGADAADIAATEIDWKAVAAGDAPVHIRQLPGANNMMGAMKFGFANDFDIFLHDTPQRALFAKAKRTASMGCIRLEHADRLARWLLGRDADPSAAEPETHVQLDKGVPIYVTYMTATVEDGQLAFVDDVYAWDAAPEGRKRSPPPPPGAEPQAFSSCSSTSRIASATACSTSSSLVSSKSASGACCSGATSRVESRSSRARMSASTSSSGRVMPAPELLLQPPLRANLRRGGDEQLRVGIGRDHRPDVAAVEHRSAGCRAKSCWRSSSAARTEG